MTAQQHTCGDCQFFAETWFPEERVYATICGIDSSLAERADPACPMHSEVGKGGRKEREAK